MEVQCRESRGSRTRRGSRTWEGFCRRRRRFQPRFPGPLPTPPGPAPPKAPGRPGLLRIFSPPGQPPRIRPSYSEHRGLSGGARWSCASLLRLPPLLRGKEREILVECTDGILLILIIMFPAQVTLKELREGRSKQDFRSDALLNSHWILPSKLNHSCCSIYQDDYSFAH